MRPHAAGVATAARASNKKSANFPEPARPFHADTQTPQQPHHAHRSVRSAHKKSGGIPKKRAPKGPELAPSPPFRITTTAGKEERGRDSRGGEEDKPTHAESTHARASSKQQEPPPRSIQSAPAALRQR